MGRMARGSVRPAAPATGAWCVEICTRSGRWQLLPEICDSEADAEDVRDAYRDERYLRFPDRRYTALRIVTPAGGPRRRRTPSPSPSPRDATLVQFAAERAAALEGIGTLREQGGAVPGACGHEQPLPTAAEVAGCTEFLLRVCDTCMQLLHWHVDEWHKMGRRA